MLDSMMETISDLRSFAFLRDESFRAATEITHGSSPWIPPVLFQFTAPNICGRSSSSHQYCSSADEYRMRFDRIYRSLTLLQKFRTARLVAMQHNMLGVHGIGGSYFRA